MSSPSWVRGALPPVLLLLALAMVFAAFGVLAFGLPEESPDLVLARAAGDDQRVEVLEGQLYQQRLKRTVLVAGLFAGAGVAVWSAFGVMRGATP